MSASDEQKKYGLGNVTLLEAKCVCGFKWTTLSGNLSKETSLAPYYCDKCGLVDVNIREVPHKCQWCKSTHVKGYGSLSISLPPKEENSYSVLLIYHPAIWRDENKIYRDGHLCPQCKKMTMSLTKKIDKKARPI